MIEILSSYMGDIFCLNVLHVLEIVCYFCFLTVKTWTCVWFLISSTKGIGRPLGTGIVAMMIDFGFFRMSLTIETNVWLKSSIFPISSMINTWDLESVYMIKNIRCYFMQNQINAGIMAVNLKNKYK